MRPTRGSQPGTQPLGEVFDEDDDEGGEERLHEQKHHDQSQQRFPHPAPPEEVLAVLLEDTIDVDLVVILQHDHVAVVRASLVRESQEREESPKRWRYAVRDMGTNDGYLFAEGWTDDGVSPGRQDQAGIAQIIVASGDLSGVAGVIADAFMCLFPSLSLKSVLDDRVRRGSGGRGCHFLKLPGHPFCRRWHAMTGVVGPAHEKKAHPHDDDHHQVGRLGKAILLREEQWRHQEYA